MRNSVSISLPTVVLRQLKAKSKEESTSWSQIVREALRQYFFKAEFNRLRRKAMIEAARKGIRVTEEEILRQVS